MNSRELARSIAWAKNIEEKDALKTIYAIADNVTDTLRKGGSVRLGSLGTFKLVRKKPRSYVDVRTKQKVTAPAKFIIAFRPSRAKRDLF